MCKFKLTLQNVYLYILLFFPVFYFLLLVKPQAQGKANAWFFADKASLDLNISSPLALIW